MTKKGYRQKTIFFSNQEILTKNLVTFKRQDSVKDEKLQYFGGSLKNRTFKGGFTKTNIEGGDYLKRGTLTVC